MSRVIGGTPPEPPENKGPEPTEQSNLTDDDSRLMRKNRRASYEQAYNCQAAVDADGSQLILSNHVTNNASDAGQLEPALAGIDPSIGRAKKALADNGYLNAAAIERVQKDDCDVYVSVGSEDGNNCRRYDFRPPKEPKPKKFANPTLVAMQEKMASEEAKKLYAKRKQTVEPVFGIVKSVLGFARFHLRGLENVSTEWSLVSLAYNFKRLHALRAAANG